ncbi:MAG TPA: nuclear transport factor 2 family protein [Pyrinomonadaceae bacterium]|nr:nuclear transport factor 2 family protein [Pyrinomonadaceae bacterium]
MGKKVNRNLEINEEFKDLERGWVAAYLQGDPELFDRVWTEGFIFTFPFAQFSNKEQALADIKSGNLAFESLSTEDMTVRIYGETAVMAGRFTMKGQYRGRDISGKYNYTNVLEKQEEHSWQIVASHAAPVA